LILGAGVDVVATSCLTCHAQLADLVKHYEIGVRVATVIELVADALVAPGK
jgi:Fe-S oxidoreductase